MIKYHFNTHMNVKLIFSRCVFIVFLVGNIYLSERSLTTNVSLNFVQIPFCLDAKEKN